MALISHDAPAKLKSFADAREIPYTMLSDAGAEIIPAFGLANPQFKKGSAWYGVALPIIFVTGPDGVIRHRFSGADKTQRVPPETILDILKKEAAG